MTVLKGGRLEYLENQVLWRTDRGVVRVMVWLVPGLSVLPSTLRTAQNWPGRDCLSQAR